MIRKVITVVGVTLVLAMIYILEMQIVNMVLKLTQWRLDYLYHVSIETGIIYAFANVAVILFCSLFFKQAQKKRSITGVGVNTGLFSIGLCLIMFLLFSQTTRLYITFVMIAPATFIMGFLFPILYRMISKKALINPNFF